MDTHLEEWIDEKLEPVKENGLPGNNVLGNISETLGAENSIEQMIGDIEDGRIRYILNYCANKEICSKEQIMNEINHYYTVIEPKLSSDPYLRHIFNLIALNNILVVNEQSLPTNLNIQLESEIVKRQSIEEDLPKLSPDVRRLVERSLEYILPSIIRLEIDKIINRKKDTEDNNGIKDNRSVKDKSIYEQLAAITNPDEKEVMENGFNRGLPLYFILEEGKDYKIIRDETDEQVKSLVKAYVNKGNTRDNAVRDIDGFRKITGYGEDTVQCIIGLINEGEENYCIDDLLLRAYTYSNTDEQVKSLVKAYVNKGNTRDNAVCNIDGFRKITGYGEDTVKYIIGLINEGEENYCIDDLLLRAYTYNNSH